MSGAGRRACGRCFLWVLSLGAFPLGAFSLGAFYLGRFLRARSFGALSPGEQALRGREQSTGGWLLRGPGSAIGVALMNLPFLGCIVVVRSPGFLSLFKPLLKISWSGAGSARELVDRGDGVREDYPGARIRRKKSIISLGRFLTASQSWRMRHASRCGGYC